MMARRCSAYKSVWQNISVRLPDSITANIICLFTIRSKRLLIGTHYFRISTIGCEIIINHMVSDSMRAVKIVKKDAARNKYEQTYLTELENLIP